MKQTSIDPSISKIEKKRVNGSPTYFITHNGRYGNLRQWSDWTGINYATLRSRAYLLKDIEQILNPKNLRVYQQINPRIEKRVKNTSVVQDTLCWACKNAVPSENCGCNWSRALKPVEGWEVRISKGYRDGYLVVRCPEFIVDETRDVECVD